MIAKLIGKFLDHTCRVYTITAVLFLLLQMLISGSADETVIRPEAFLLILPFAAGVAMANLIYKTKKLPLAGRLLLHFVLVVLSAFLFLYMPMLGADKPGSHKLMTLALFAVAYVAVMGLYSVVALVIRRIGAPKEEYESAFASKKK